MGNNAKNNARNNARKKKTVKSDMVKKCKILPDKTNNHVM